MSYKLIERSDPVQVAFTRDGVTLWLMWNRYTGRFTYAFKDAAPGTLPSPVEGDGFREAGSLADARRKAREFFDFEHMKGQS